MGWVVFFIAALIIFFLINPFKKWKEIWYAGLISLVIIFLIDSTLISLDAFSYQYSNPLLGELPAFYWLSSFFGGIVLVYYYPERKLARLPYIMFASLLFLLLELFMNYVGYFKYINWSIRNSFFLNIFGFTIVIWLWNWVNEITVKTGR